MWHAFLPKRAFARTWAAPLPCAAALFLCGRQGYGPKMLYFIIKSALSGVIVAAVSEIARRFPGWGGLVASLPLTSLLAMIWLWHDSGGDTAKIIGLSNGVFWFLLPSMPLFLMIPALLRGGVGFWPTLALACGVTLALYAAFFWVAPRLGIAL